MNGSSHITSRHITQNFTSYHQYKNHPDSLGFAVKWPITCKGLEARLDVRHVDGLAASAQPCVNPIDGDFRDMIYMYIRMKGILIDFMGVMCCDLVEI